MNVVLVHPEIPHNSGCAGRLTAALGARLHLVGPLGFSLEDRYLKRAGLDYWHLVDLSVHPSVEACFREVAFAPDDVLVFGSESKGLPPKLVKRYLERRVRIPIAEGIRSLNLANAVAIALFTAQSNVHSR